MKITLRSCENHTPAVKLYEQNKLERVRIVVSSRSSGAFFQFPEAIRNLVVFCSTFGAISAIVTIIWKPVLASFHNRN